MSATTLSSFSVGMSLFTSRVPSNSSCSCCKTGVWLDGENGGVVLSPTSSEALGSAIYPVCECGGDGICVVCGCGADVTMGGGTGAVGLPAEVSMLTVVESSYGEQS
jgi:hypothetical protein